MGIGNAKPDTPAAWRCARHLDRFAAVTVNGVGCCWECYLPPKVYAARFKADFYTESKPCQKPSN